MQRRLSRKRPLFSIAVEIQELTLCIPSSSSMSIYAFDQLVFSTTGKHSLTSTNKKRDFLLDASQLLASSTVPQQKQEHTIRIAQRFPFQGTLRPRSYGLKPQLLSMHLYGLKKSGWPKTLLASFSVNVIEHMHALQSKRDHLNSERRYNQVKHITIPANGGLCPSSHLQLSLDGLLIHKAKDENANDPQLFSPSLLNWGRFSLPSTPKSIISLDPDPSRNLFRRNSMFPFERQIELVGWRRGRKRSQRTSPRQYGEKVRRASSYEPREFSEQMNDEMSSEDEDERVDELETFVATPEYTAPEYTAGDRWRQNKEAEQANASLASELMTRRLSRTPAEWAQVKTGVDAASHYIEFHNAHSHSDDTLSDEHETSGVVSTPDDTTIALRKEVETLRTEHADQRELIRRLLIENKRLQMEMEGCTSCHGTPSQSLNQQEIPHEIVPKHRPSLTFTVIDGQQVVIDHHFDDIVHEMESDFEKLLGSTPSLIGSRQHRSIGKR